MQGPSIGSFVASFVPWLLMMLVWLGWAALAVWAVLLLRQISRSLESIRASLARIESRGERL